MGVHNFNGFSKKFFFISVYVKLSAPLIAVKTALNRLAHVLHLSLTVRSRLQRGAIKQRLKIVK